VGAVAHQLSALSVQRSAEIAVLVLNLKSTKNHAIGLRPKAQIGAPLFLGAVQLAQPCHLHP